MKKPALLLALSIAAACGGAQTRDDAAPVPGDVDAPPSMAALPGTRALEPEFSERMRFGFELAEEAFTLQPPPPPASAKVADVQAWSDGALKDWLQRRQHAVDSARRELDLAAEEAHPQRVVAGAVIGLLYEDIARVLRGIPVPDEVQEEPEMVEIYREVVDSNASPYLEYARRAYRACAANAEGPDELRPWSSFCSGRADRLPGNDEDVPDGTTVVVVEEDE